MFDSTGCRRARVVMRAAAVVAGLFGVVGPGLAQDTETGLVAHYAFERNLLDDGPGRHDGLAVGSPDYVRGLRGLAISLDGSADALQFPGIPNAVWNAPFSAAWFMQVDDLQRYSLLSKRDACSAGNHFDVQLGDGAPADVGFALSRAGQVGTTIARAPAEEGPWVHVAIVRDASSIRVYVDGRSGPAVSVGTSNFTSLRSALAFGGSPCIGDIGGPRRYQGLLDELRIYDRALSSADVASLARVASLSIAPASGSPGTRLTARMNNLEPGRTYELRLRQGRTVNQLLATVSNASATEAASATVPALAAGSYEVALLQRQPLQLTGGTLVRSTPFTIAPGLVLGITTTQPQAGKPAVVTVGNLVPGSLQLKYGSRIVYGPTPAAAGSSSIRFLVPADFPATFPADITLRAELLSGRTVIRSGSATVTVSAPFTGSFATPTGIASSVTRPRPSEPVRLSGRIALADGATIENTQVSAYWRGDNGQVTPLPSRVLQRASDGAFTLETRAPSFISMTATQAGGPGRVQIATSRVNQVTGRREFVVNDGPALTNEFDSDPQADVTVFVRARGASSTVPLRGAYIVVDRDAPVQQALLGLPPDGEPSPYGSVVSTVFEASNPTSILSQRQAEPVNQLTSTVYALPRPEPGCGVSLFRRYTNASGRAEFLLQGYGSDGPSSWAAARTTSMQAIECAGGSCPTMTLAPVADFTITVYTLHLGAGYRLEDGSNAEDPSRFRVRYALESGAFTITNLRTGQVTTQQTSANIFVEVPLIAAGGAFVTMSDPIVRQGLPGQNLSAAPRIGANGFGKWVDFEGIDGQFVNPAPIRRIKFKHLPDAGGSITSARLFLRSASTGEMAPVGTFSRVGEATGCTIQDDGSVAGEETWQYDFPLVLSESWRTPRGVFFPSDASERRSCGYIEATNSTGGRGRKSICFHWQPFPPGFSGGRSIHDEDMNRVYLERTERFNSAQTELTLPPTIDGEPIQQPRRRDNETVTERTVVDTINSNGLSFASRNTNGTNDRQFANVGTGRSDSRSLGNGVNEITLGSSSPSTIIDQSVPLFNWTWGIPELFGAQVYADLQLLVQYLFSGRLSITSSNAERLDLITNPSFGININAGVDLDVLFGLLFDARAYLTGTAISSMPTVIENNVVTRSGPCFIFRMTFTGYFDPAPFLPTPVITDTHSIIDDDTPNGCSIYTAPGSTSPLLSAVEASLDKAGPTTLEQRQLRRHPTLAFDADGNGQMAMLDARQALVIAAIEGGVPQPSRTLSTGVNPRQAKIVYYAADRAVAVWAESALTLAQAQNADTATLSRNQRIMAAHFNGAGWSKKVALTTPSGGEGFPEVAACYARTPGCPAEGEVVAVWQRNQGTDFRNPTHRIKFARYVPASGWSAVGDVAAETGGAQDITPSVSYLAGNPFVVWARSDTAALGTFARRRLAYRHLGVGAVQLASNVPTGPIAPSLRAVSSDDVVVAFTRADDGTGPIGTRQALHAAFGSCRAGSCTWTWRRAADRYNRAIYGERPQLVVNATGETTVVMRTLQFRDDGISGVQPGDPIGTVLGSGDLVAIPVARNLVRSRTVSITADGATHFGVSAAFNPLSDEIATAAATYVPESLVGLMAALKSAGPTGQVAYGKAVASVGMVEMRALPSAPDLGVEEVTTDVQSVAPNAAAQATVRIGNRGAGFDTSADGVAKLELRWNLPTGTGEPLASVNLANLAAGEARDVVLNFSLPATAFADEAHTLYAVIVPAETAVELAGDNNVGSVAFPGLPVPTELATSAEPGLAPVQLAWAAPDDPRVVGYRVYRLEGGQWLPLGSSNQRGFLDLSAQFGVQRTYAITSYSARGVESERSESITTMPVPAAATDSLLFRDDFEASAP